MITRGKYKERVNINLLYRNESLSFLFPTVNVSVEAGSESYSKHFLLNPPPPHKLQRGLLTPRAGRYLSPR